MKPILLAGALIAFSLFVYIIVITAIVTAIT